MRKLTMMVGVVSLMVVMFAPMAMATSAYPTKTCQHSPCFGTKSAELLYERRGAGVADTIFGLRGADVILANRYGGDIDVIFGGRGADVIYTNDFVGDPLDTVFGGRGDDTCYVDAGDIVFGCEHVHVSR